MEHTIIKTQNDDLPLHSMQSDPPMSTSEKDDEWQKTSFQINSFEQPEASSIINDTQEEETISESPDEAYFSPIRSN